MEFFLSLADVGSTAIVTFFNNIIDFFNTPVSNLLNFTAVTTDITSSPVIHNPSPGISTVGSNPLVKLWKSFTSWLFMGSSSGTPINPSVNSSISSIPGRAIYGILDLLGFDLSQPLWLFMISNLSIILTFTIIARLFDIFS